MKKLMLIAAALAALLAVVLGVGVGGLGASAVTLRHAPPGDAIVSVAGDAANGFEIHHYDGSAIYPPTDSEARAECSEYDTRVARVRCRTEVRTWYRDLADLQVALHWARLVD